MVASQAISARKPPDARCTWLPPDSNHELRIAAIAALFSHSIFLIGHGFNHCSLIVPISATSQMFHVYKSFPKHHHCSSKSLVHHLSFVSYAVSERTANSMLTMLLALAKLNFACETKWQVRTLFQCFICFVTISASDAHIWNAISTYRNLQRPEVFIHARVSLDIRKSTNMTSWEESMSYSFSPLMRHWTSYSEHDGKAYRASGLHFVTPPRQVRIILVWVVLWSKDIDTHVLAPSYQTA